jgi:hypothetical protein
MFNSDKIKSLENKLTELDRQQYILAKENYSIRYEIRELRDINRKLLEYLDLEILIIQPEKEKLTIVKKKHE